MKRLLLLVLIAINNIATAQTIDTIITIKTFTVQGIRQADSLENNPSNPYLIDHLEIKNTPIQSTSDLLDNAVGIDIKSRSGLGVQSDLSIRGGTFDQSLLMIDGVKLSDPQTGHHLMDVPVFIDQIERIEQINNGGSRWFGPYAFSGAVNLITKRASESGLQLRLSGGDFGYLDAGFSVSGVGKNSSTTLSFNRRQSTGYITNTDFDLNNIFLSSNFDLNKTTFKLNAGITEKNFGAQNFYTSRFPNQYETTQTYFGSLQATLDLDQLQITPRVYYRRHYDRFELYRKGEGWYEEEGRYLVRKETRDTVPGWYTGPNYHRTDVQGAELNFSYTSALGQTSIGGEYRHEFVWSNNLGEPSDTLSDLGNAAYTKTADRENSSLFFEHNVTLNRFRISAGLLANFHSVYGNDVFPGADVSYDLSDQVRVFAGANRNMRFPTFTDLYYNLGGAVGSRNLEPEQSQNYQLGFKYRFNWFSGSITGFYRQGQNLIDWVRLNGSPITQAANITEVNFIGIEMNEVLDLRKLYDDKKVFFNQITFRYTGMEADKSSEGFESNYVLDYLRHKLNVGVDHSLIANLNLAWNFKYQYREGGYYDASTKSEILFGSYGLLDVRLYQETPIIYWYVEVANLFNRQYEDIGFVQQPGRWLRVGIKYNISFKKKAE